MSDPRTPDIQLKPCDYCGDAINQSYVGGDEIPCTSWAVECGMCLAQGPTAVTPELAAEKWNDRRGEWLRLQFVQPILHFIPRKGQGRECGVNQFAGQRFSGVMRMELSKKITNRVIDFLSDRREFRVDPDEDIGLEFADSLEKEIRELLDDE